MRKIYNAESATTPVKETSISYQSHEGLLQISMNQNHFT